MRVSPFVKIAAVSLGATLLPSRIQSPKITEAFTQNNASPIPSTESEIPFADHTLTRIDLAQWAARDSSLHLTEQQVIESLECENRFEVTYPVDSAGHAQATILVDNQKGFIAFNNKKIIMWDVDEKDYKKRKNLHPIIHGTPTLNGESLDAQKIPLSRTAVQQNPLWHENLNPEIDLLPYLPKPPEGKKYHAISPAPTNPDFRDISHFSYQRESEKLAYNILNWQPDRIEGQAQYPLSNNQFLLHVMATESSLFDKIGPHPSRVSGQSVRVPTPDGMDKVIWKEGSYAGMSQMGVNRNNGNLTGSILGTPLTKNGRWAGLEIDGQIIDSKQAYLNNWQAQMVATVSSQLSTYPYVDNILRQRKTDRKGDKISTSGAFMMAHLVGPKAAYDYFLLGKNAKDGNNTSSNYYYTRFKGYDDKLFYPAPAQRKDIILRVTPLQNTQQVDENDLELLPSKYDATPLEIPFLERILLEKSDRDSTRNR